jgi:hypothetical protein
MKTRLTADQRRQLRDYISAIGVSGNPVLLKALAEIDDDFELLTICVVASAFDRRTPQQTSEFLKARGICATHIARALKVVFDSVQGQPFVHGWN